MNMSKTYLKSDNCREVAVLLKKMTLLAFFLQEKEICCGLYENT